LKKFQRKISSKIKGVEIVRKILEQKGSKILEIAKKEVLNEKIESKEIRQALSYQMSRWHDTTRPALISLACEAVGGKSKNVISIAKAVTLLCSGIDAHDDIIDKSEIKKFRPTMYGKFGGDIALLAADALIFKGLTILQEARNINLNKFRLILNVVKDLIFEIGDAEALELRFRGRTDVSPEEYLEVIRKKAADVEAYMYIGAILGDGSKEEIEALRNYGRSLGVIAILRDELSDILDFRGELLHRIEKETLPLPVFYALQDRNINPLIISILRKKEIRKEEAERLLELTDEAGGLRKVGEIMHNFASNGIKFLNKIEHHRETLNFIMTATLPRLDLMNVKAAIF
jgi:geranylgeranyl diphosphate synthase type I